MKNFLKICLCAFLIIVLGACRGGTNAFTVHVEAVPDNLDPQIATGAQNITAGLNLYGRLLRVDADGILQPDLATAYTISPDGKTYTFELDKTANYLTKSNVNKDYTLTANDFVFAFERIFTASTKSPYVNMFSSIKNSIEVLEGALPVSALGVKATDDYTLEITLKHADEAFIENLAHPAASPCNEEFFEQTGGTYGLSSSKILSSGSFYFYNWTSSGLFLRRNTDSTKIDSLRIVTHENSEGLTAEELILAGESSVALDKSFSQTQMNNVTFSDTTWALVYNTRSTLSNTALRKALSVVANGCGSPDFGKFSSDNLTGLLPSEIEIDLLPYLKKGETQMSFFDEIHDTSAYYSEALASLDVAEIQKITLLAPENSGLENYVATINSAWQKAFSLFFSVEIVDTETFTTRLATADYTIALCPIVYDTGDALTYMQNFESLINSNDYTALLKQAQNEIGTKKITAIKKAEKMLIENCVITPLCYEQKRLLINPNIKNLVYNPYSGTFDLTYTEISS